MPSDQPSVADSFEPSFTPSSQPSSSLDTGMECKVDVAVTSSVAGVPKCPTRGAGCSTDGTSLLAGRKGMSGSSSKSNTLDSCVDGSSGTYLSDESNEALTITSDFYHLVAGQEAYVVAKVWAYGTGESDTADFYYTTNPTVLPLNWTYIGSETLSGGGYQYVTSPSFTLPSAEEQAVRVNFRHKGSEPSSCSGGSFDDTDDLMVRCINSFFALSPHD